MKSQSFKDRCRAANERADIVSVAMRLGMEVRTQAAVPFAHCPFHGDTGRMNLAFYQQPGNKADLPRCYCFTCRTQATALDLVMEMRKCNIFEALEWLQDFVGIGEGYAPPLPVRQIQRPVRPRTDKRKAVEQAAERLWGPHGKEARDYLEHRGVIKSAREYTLGYWADDNSRWAGRVTIPYLDGEHPASPVWTMVGARIRRDVAGHANQDGQHSPKYLYTSSDSRQPYLWQIALSRAEREGYLILCEGELDALSLLTSLPGAPVSGLGGVGAISAAGNEPRLAGLDILYIADLEAVPRYGTEYEEKDKQKLDRITKTVGENVWKLKQLNSNIRVVYPPDINHGGKTDVNDLLMSYGVEGVLDWLLPELDTLTSGGDDRSLI